MRGYIAPSGVANQTNKNDKKAQDCKDAIEELYDKERDLIKQKYQNILDYYGDLENYYDSIVSLVDSRVNLKNAMGQKTNLTDMLRQYQAQIDLYENQRLAYLKYALGATETSDETTLEDAVKAFNSTQERIIDSEWYQSLSDRINYLLNFSANFSKEQKRIADLQQQYFNNGYPAGLRETPATARNLKLNRNQRRDLRNSSLLAGLVNQNGEAFRAYRRLEKRRDRLASRGTENLNNRQQKRLDKLNASMDNLSNIMQRLGNIVTDEGIINSTTFQQLLYSVAKQANKGISSKRAQNRLDSLTKELEDIAANATSSNIVQYRAVYEALDQLNRKEQRRGKLNTKDSYTRERLQVLQNDLIRQRTAYDERAQRQLDIARSLADPSNIDSLTKGRDALQLELATLYNEKEQELIDGIKLSQTYIKLANKNKNGKNNAKLEALLKYGTSETTEEEAAQIVKDIETVNKGKRNDAYFAALDRLNQYQTKRENAINELQAERASQIREALLEYDTMLAEAEEKANEALADAYEIAKSMVEFDIDNIKAYIDQLDTLINRYESLIDLLQEFDVDVLDSVYNFDFDMFGLDKAKDNLELLAETYNNAIATSMEEYENANRLAKTYDKLISIATADGAKTNWSDVFAEYKNSIKGSSEEEAILTTLADLESKLAANNYTDNSWVDDWKQGFEEAKISIIDNTKAIQQLKNELRENVTFKVAKEAIEDYEAISNRLSDIGSLIKEEWYFDDNGITEYGLARVKLLSEEREALMGEISEYERLLASVQAEQFESEDAYEEYLRDLTSSYDAANKNLQSVDDEIVNIGKRAREEEISQIEKVIDLYKDALSQKKSYYDYDKNIKSQTKDIQALRAEIAALSAVNTAESKSRVKALQEQLSEKEDQLEETRKEHEYDMMTDALDKLVMDLKASLEDSSKDIATTIKEWGQILVETIESAADANAKGSVETISGVMHGEDTHPYYFDGDLENLRNEIKEARAYTAETDKKIKELEQQRTNQQNDVQNVVDTYKDRSVQTFENMNAQINAINKDYDAKIAALDAKNSKSFDHIVNLLVGTLNSQSFISKYDTPETLRRRSEELTKIIQNGLSEIATSYDINIHRVANAIIQEIVHEAEDQYGQITNPISFIKELFRHSDELLEDYKIESKNSIVDPIEQERLSKLNEVLKPLSEEEHNNYEAAKNLLNAMTNGDDTLSKEISNLTKSVDQANKVIEAIKNYLDGVTDTIVYPEGWTGVSGLAHAYGNANASLFGELGAETVVDPHRGTYEVVGKNGAELRNLPKDAIVFNNKQTEELFSKGKIRSRGKAFANGANNNVAGLIASGILKPVGGGSRLSITPQLASALTDGSGAITKLVNEYNVNNSYVASLIEGMQNYYSSMQSSMNHITRNFDARISDVVNAVNGLQNGSTVNPAMLAAMMSSNNGITYQQMKSMGMTVKYH